MYTFIQLTHAELNQICSDKNWSTIWKLIEPPCVQSCEKVIDNVGNLIAVIYYDLTDNPKLICKFEVRSDLRNQGHGRKIIAQFLKQHPFEFHLFPDGEDAERFWRKCGFEGDQYELWYDL